MESASLISSHSGLRKDEFSNVFRSEVCTLECNALATAGHFSTSLTGVQLGAIDVLHYEGVGLRSARRDLRHFRQDRIDDILVVLPLTASTAVTQAGNSAVITPGTCVLLATNKPFEGICGAAPDYFYSENVVRVPGPLFRRYVPYIDGCSANNISVELGAGHVMASMIDCLLQERSAYSGSQAERLGQILVAAISNVLLEAPELAEVRTPHNSSAHTELVRFAKSFIESNLSDNSLGPEMVAKHCGVSVPHLHSVFSKSSLSVGKYIRTQRLLQCHQDMQNPILAHQSIMQIAMCWGFGSYASFHRAYRSQFRVAPRATRTLSH